MRTLLLSFIFLLFFQASMAQRTTLSVSAMGGLSSFRGSSAVKTGWIGTGGFWCDCQAVSANPFGTRWGLAYGLAATVQIEFGDRFLAGTEVGYESLRNQSVIDRLQVDDAIFRFDDLILPKNKKNGKNRTSSQFIQVFPHLGYTLARSQGIEVKVLVGTDLGFGINSYAQPTLPRYFSDLERKNMVLMPSLDLRPRIQLSVYRQRLGLNAGYAHGLTNWAKQERDGRAYLGVVRLGVSYKLLSPRVL